MTSITKYICIECFNKELIFWYSDLYCLKCKKKFDKKYILKKLEKVILKKFKVIDHGYPDPTFEPGGISTTIRLVQCPLCNHQFNQKITRGCFGGSEYPFSCPKCNFRLNVSDLYWKLIKKVKI